MFGDFHEHGTFTTLRGADYVLVTTPATGEDTIQYAGVARERVTLVPMEFDPPALADAARRGDRRRRLYCLAHHSSLHKNHLLTLEALQEFLDDSETIRKVVVTGVNSQLLSPSMELPPEFAGADHVAKARQFLASRPRLLQRLDFRGELPRESYLRLVSRSRFLLHPATYDNGTYAVVEAAWLGVPAVSADYPAMRFIHSYFDLPLTFFRPSSAAELVVALRAAESGTRQRWPPRCLLASAWQRHPGATSRTISGRPWTGCCREGTGNFPWLCARANAAQSGDWSTSRRASDAMERPDEPQDRHRLPSLVPDHRRGPCQGIWNTGNACRTAHDAIHPCGGDPQRLDGMPGAGERADRAAGCRCCATWFRRLVRRIGAWIFASMTMWSFALRVLLVTPLILLAAPLLLVAWLMRGIGRFARGVTALMAASQRRFEKVRRVSPLQMHLWHR